MIDKDVLNDILGEYLVNQRWFACADDQTPTCQIVLLETLVDEWPKLFRVLVHTTLPREDGGGTTYQLVIGMRPVGSHTEFLNGSPEAVIASEVDTPDGPAIIYDATTDTELMVALINLVVEGTKAERGRLVSTDSTHTSIVFDERLIMKLFRELGAGGRSPDAEVTRSLTRVGFSNVANAVAEWRDEVNDYAVISEFLVGASDGFLLALTSLRDLYDCRCDPEDAGGDFAPDARRLGVVTANLHLALAEAFPTESADSVHWSNLMEERLSHASLPGIDLDLVHAVYERLASVKRAGISIRSHGDYHLAQVIRTDGGWFVVDFEGEPGSSYESRLEPSSPLRDVAGMIRSFHYAAQVALRERAEAIDERIVSLSSAWERRNRFAFMEGYLSVDRISSLLPPGTLDQDVIITAFELDKAIYEVGYEQQHRPDWVGIPLAAVARIVGNV